MHGILTHTTTVAQPVGLGLEQHLREIAALSLPAFYLLNITSRIQLITQRHTPTAYGIRS